MRSQVLDKPARLQRMARDNRSIDMQVKYALEQKAEYLYEKRIVHDPMSLKFFPSPPRTIML